MKIEAMIMQSHLRWYGHVIHQDINLQRCEVIELEIIEKRKNGLPKK